MFCSECGWLDQPWMGTSINKIWWLFLGEECSLCPLLYYFITSLLVQAAALLNMNATYVSKLQVKKFDELSGRKLCHDSLKFFFSQHGARALGLRHQAFTCWMPFHFCFKSCQLAPILLTSHHTQQNSFSERHKWQFSSLSRNKIANFSPPLCLLFSL